MGMDQRFLLKLSATREAPRILALNGNAIADGRPVPALAKRDPMPLGPAAGSVVSTNYKVLIWAVWDSTFYFCI